MPVSEQQIEQLQSLTRTKLEKMFLDKKETPKLLIPKSLPSFIRTPLYRKFLLAVYDYCSTFNDVIKDYGDLNKKLGINTTFRQQQTQNEGKKQSQTGAISMQRGIEVKLLQSQKEELGKLEREVSYCYSQVILSFNMECLKEDGKRSNFKDQVFFEALIYLIERVLKEMFTREQFLLIQEEIHRLFRTNRYNLIKKRHENDLMLQKYPALKQHKQKHKNNLASILARAPERIAAFKKLQKQKRNVPSQSVSYDYTETLGIPKQLMNPDMEQRSPLLCTWLPSKKTMVNDLNLVNSQQNYLQAINYSSKKKIDRTVDSGYSYEYSENMEEEEGRKKRQRTRMASLGHHMMSSPNDLGSIERGNDSY